MHEVKCTKCGLTKNISEFYKDKQKKSGYRPDCKICSSIRKTPLNRAEVNLNSTKYRTGISKDIYKSLLLEQDDKCAICSKSTIDNGRNLAIDHCHKTNFVRGLLCLKCNAAIGYFDDNIDLLYKAINYLSNNKMKDKIQYKCE